MANEIYESLKINVEMHALRCASDAYARQMQPKLAELAKADEYEQIYKLRELLAEYLHTYTHDLARRCQRYHDLAVESLNCSAPKPIQIPVAKAKP